MKIITMIIFGLFCALSQYSWDKTHSQQPHLVSVWRNQHAADIAEIYNISIDEVGKEVVLWEKK